MSASKQRWGLRLGAHMRPKRPIQRVAPDAQIRDHALAIARQAQSVADNNTSADVHAVALLILDNARTLAAWTKPREGGS